MTGQMIVKDVFKTVLEFIRNGNARQETLQLTEHAIQSAETAFELNQNSVMTVT